MPTKTKAEKEQEKAAADAKKEQDKLAKENDKALEQDRERAAEFLTTDPDAPKAEQTKAQEERQEDFTKLADKHETSALKENPVLAAKRQARQANIAEQDSLHRNGFGRDAREFAATNHQAGTSRKSDVRSQTDPSGNRFGSTGADREFGSQQAATDLPGYGTAAFAAPEPQGLTLDEPLTPRDAAALLQATNTGGFADVRKAVQTIAANAPVPNTPQTAVVEVTKEVSVDANAHAEHGNEV